MSETGNAELTFAGVPLPLSNPLDEWIDYYISTLDIFEFASRSWPGTRLLKMTFNYFIPRRPVVIGSFNWPVGASRWGYANYIVSDAELAVIRPLCYGETGPANQVPQLLVIDDGINNITTPMYMLPPRHLTGANVMDAYLLTLVDQRWYWWQENAGVLEIDEGTTQWSDLYLLIGEQLGVSIAVDPIDHSYLTPSGVFGTYYESLPILLDAIAFNCGQSIVVNFDGSVSALNLSSSVRDGNVELSDQILGGGSFDFDQVIP